MGTQTYELKELANLLGWNPAHCKVILKQLGKDPSAPIDEETAAMVAQKIRRQWPPAAAEQAAV